MKARELWTDGILIFDDEELAKEIIKSGAFLVREVKPIDWEKVWKKYDGLERFDHLQIQELVEKHLVGDE